MSKLQNNFTTPEQSKRLLELGVPADSANLFYSKFECETFENRPTLCYGRKYSDIVPSGYEKNYLPCWSVGRLIEIHRICSTLPEEQYMFPFWYDIQDNVDWAIRVLESGIKTGNIYFSNLEEYL
jgi:hypothetical protein